ncbi:MAG TPA: winged helix-turn-helix domain-containing protein, partial [Clostridiales bacterium]|nr:winged helix-turn-helix domain-containing protein [Clostridiales bacterium]
DLTVDIAAKTVKRGDKYISLSAKEFALLEYMVRNQEIVLTRDMIENNCWNYDYEGGTNVVDVYISYLRKKIDSGFEKKLIHTVWGTGWILRSEE